MKEYAFQTRYRVLPADLQTPVGIYLKVRAIQLIDEMEPHPRGLYGGCIGYIGLDGSLNQAITIRSFLSLGQRLYCQGGAGIVAHSDPRSELSEVNNKLGALMAAVDRAEEYAK